MKLETIIEADEKLCIRCGNCVRTCPSGLITGHFPEPIPNSWDLCIDCGHCVAVCPTGAMSQRTMTIEDCEPIDIHLIPKWDRVRQFLVSRRSVRVYISGKPVEKEKIEQLLDVTRFAPNGANRQVLRWLVVSDPTDVRRIAEMSIGWMKSMKDAKPALYEDARMQMFIDAWEAGQDQISMGGRPVS